MTDPSRREAAEAGERQEETETAESGWSPQPRAGEAAAETDHDHTVAAEPADPNAGVVRARPPTTTALFVAAALAGATLIVLVAAALAG